jgi:RNA polymerase sigma-70 factor (ECF subfamily)
MNACLTIDTLRRKLAGTYVYTFVSNPYLPSSTLWFGLPERRRSRPVVRLLMNHRDIISPIPAEAIDLRRLMEDCLSGKPEQWSAFVAHCHPVIQAAVVRSIRRCGTPTPELAEDLVQDAYVRLCADNYRVLRDFRFSDSGGLYGLLEAVAVSVTFDCFRRRIAVKRGAGHEPVPIDHAPDVQLPDASSQRITERHVLFQEIDRHLQAITSSENAARDRRVFWLYYRHGFSAKEIAALPSVGLTPKGVESNLHRLTTQLREIVRGFSEFEKGEGA